MLFKCHLQKPLSRWCNFHKKIEDVIHEECLAFLSLTYSVSLNIYTNSSVNERIFLISSFR